MALEIRCRVRARPSDRWEVRHTGTHVPPPGSPDAVLTGARSAVGSDHPMRLEVRNLIPIGSGLGSSAAAYTAGMVAALRCRDRPVDPMLVFGKVAKLEGHSDNAAAAVFGGLVLVDSAGRVHRLRLSDAYGLLMVVPAFRLFTPESRKVVAESFDRGIVVRSLARMAALTAGLASGEAGVLEGAMGDEIHESGRNRLRPRVGEFMQEALRAGAVYAAWSGSGPSIVVLTRASETDRVGERIRVGLGGGVEILRPDPARHGIL